MSRERLRPGEKPLHWVGSAKRDFLGFPEQVVRDMGYALGLAQLGGKHPAAKPWKGRGPGVLELVEDYEGDAYRAIYAVRFEKAIYVLHAFQKKSPTGIKTAQKDIDLVARRLMTGQQDYETLFGKRKD
ncbi:MAG: type II toxin-antitoxin system RelE/ParE family toxin [Rhodospirillales bacterium]|nr:type II toxin-antitoxin system RelE/ParE family toxin [Rhodospirillales bacterium]